MATHQKFDRICAAVLIFMIVLTILFMTDSIPGVTRVVDEDAETYTGDAVFTDNDQNSDWDQSHAVQITLDGTDGEIDGSGAYFYDGDLVISNGGYYVISGELTDGSIRIDTNQSAKVWIALAGVSISCSDDACLRVEEADKVFLTLAADTVNSMVSGETYSEEALEDGTGGVIFSHDDLTINGSGSLTLEAGYKHGIDCNDDLVIAGGRLHVKAPGDGLRGNDSIRITQAEITMNVEDDGMHPDTWIYILDGDIQIDSCYEGIEAPTVDILGGNITIYPQDDGINANGDSNETGGGMGMPMQQMQMDSASVDTTGNIAEDADEDQPAGSEEEMSTITISGGTITVVNPSGFDADGIDSNGDILISGGTILVSLTGGGGNNALDFGSENGGRCVIDGGTVIACASSNMMEAISEDSSQNTVTWVPEEAGEADTELTVTDEDGNTILSQVIPCDFTAVTVSTSLFENGKTYTLNAGNCTQEVMFEDSSVISLGSTGAAMAGGMQGGMLQMGAGQAPAGEMQQMGAGQAPAGEMPQMEGGQTSEGTTEEESGEMPEGLPQMGTGEAPTGEMPQMEGGQAPTGEMRGGGPQNGGQRGNGMMQQERQFMSENSMDENMNTGVSADENEESTGTGKNLSAYSQETWLLLGACFIALAAGVIFAMIYPRRR